MRTDARLIYDAAIAAVQPGYLIPKYLRIEGNILTAGHYVFDLRQYNVITVITVGKAAAAMAFAAETILEKRINKGLVLTKYEHSLPLRYLPCIEAGHPVPDGNGIAAAKRIAELAEHAGENELIIFLLSGGASALMADLVREVPVIEFEALTKQLLKSGADITEMNAVRKHLSFLKGGQLARLAWPASIISLVLSDVPGDLPDTIGSGPTVADSTGFADALQVIEKYNLKTSTGNAILQYLENGIKGIIPETPKPGNDQLSRAMYELIGNNRIALEAAKTKAVSLGYHTVISEIPLEGEARMQATELLRSSTNYEDARPFCLLAGGETTVTVKGSGKGGRNQELALAATVQMLQSGNEFNDTLLLAAASDGTDGPTDAAGAFADKELIRFINDQQLDPLEFLNDNNAYEFFRMTDAHLITGATQTNVMDFAIVLKH